MSATSVLLNEADASMTAGDWDGAIEKLQLLKESDVNSADVFERLAKLNAIRGRFLTVLSVYLEWAETSLERAEFEEAEKALAYALNLRPDSTEVHEMGVRIARQNVDLDLLSQRLLELASLYLERGEGDRSVALVQEAIQVKPEDESLPLQLAEFYVSLGQISSALRQYEEYITQYADCGTPEKLLGPLRRLRLLKADDKENLLKLGRVCLALDLIDEAEEQFRAVLKLDLENSDALFELAGVCQRKGRFRNGLLALTRVLQMKPNFPLALRRTAEIHLASGDSVAAVDNFLEAARAYGEAAEVHSAADLYRTILSIDPQNSRALSGLASLDLDDEDLSDSFFPPLPESKQKEEPQVVLQADSTDSGFRELSVTLSSSEEEPDESKIRTKRRPDLVRKSELMSEFGERPLFRREAGHSLPKRKLREGLGFKSGVAAKPILKPTMPSVPEKEPPLEQPLPESAELVSPVSDASEFRATEEEFVIEEDLFKGIEISQESDFDIPSFDELFEPLPESLIEAKAEVEAGLLFEPEPEAEAGPLFEPEPESEIDPELLFEPEPEAEAELLFEPEPEAEVEAELLFEPEAEVEAELLFEPEPEAEVDPELLFEPEPELEVEAEHLSEPEPEFEAEVDPELLFEPEAEAAEVSTESESEELGFEVGFPWTQEQDADFLFPLDEQFPPLFEEFTSGSEILEEAEKAPMEDLGLTEPFPLESPAESERDSLELTEILESTIPSPPLIEEPQEEVKQQEPPEPIIIPEPATQETEAEPVPENVEFDAGARIIDCRRVLKKFPSDEAALEQLGDHCLRFGLLEEALDSYQKLLKVNPGSFKTLDKVVKTALWMEDYDVVKKSLWKVAKLHFDRGNLSLCQERLGDLLALDSDHKQARQLMVEVFRAAGDDKLAAWHLGSLVERCVAEGDTDNAIISLKRLHEVSPSESVLERLGELHLALSQTTEAQSIYRQLRDSYDARQESEKALWAAQTLVKLNPNEGVDREIWIQLLERHGNLAEALEQKLQLARVYKEQAQIQQAKILLKQILSVRPSLLEAECSLVELYLQSGELELAEQHSQSLAEGFLEQKAYTKAIQLYENWLRVAPDSFQIRERLAQAYQLYGDLQGAKLVWLLVAESHHALGDFERSARALERALELEPEQREWRLRLAELKARELQQVEAALTEFRRLFAADPDWSRATLAYLDLLIQEQLFSELGRALSQIGETQAGAELKDKTLSAVRSRLTAEPENLSLAFGWGELCLNLGSLDLAIEQFQRLRRHSEYQLHCYRLLGLCFAKKKGFNMLNLALSQFKKGLALENQAIEDLVQLRYDLARVLRDHDQIEASLEQFRHCAQENPDYLDVREQILALEELTKSRNSP